MDNTAEVTAETPPVVPKTRLLYFRLGALLDGLQMPVSEAARRCHTSRQHLSQLISGDNSPTLKTINRIAHGLGVDPEALVGVR